MCELLQNLMNVERLPTGLKSVDKLLFKSQHQQTYSRSLSPLQIIFMTSYVQLKITNPTVITRITSLEATVIQRR